MQLVRSEMNDREVLSLLRFLRGVLRKENSHMVLEIITHAQSHTLSHTIAH